MTSQDLQDFWRSGAEESWKTVEALVETKRYAHALFFCHLTLEKLLKGKYVERHQKPAPPVHDLAWLANQAKIQLSPEEQEILAQITKFNIAGRYEDYKNELYHQASSTYTIDWVAKTNTIRQKIMKYYAKT